MRPISNGLDRRLGAMLAGVTLLAALGTERGAHAQDPADAPSVDSPGPTAGQRLDAVLAAAATPGTQSLAVLVAAAEDSDPWVRRAAIGALGSRGFDRHERHDAALGLLQALRSIDDDTREVAAAAAAELRAPELRDALAGLAGDPQPRVAAQALAALQALGDPSVAPAVALVLKRTEDSLRHRALVTLQGLATARGTGAAAQDRASLQQLEAGFQQVTLAVTALAHEASASMLLRQHAVLVLGALPTQSARAALETLATDPDPTIAQQAQLVLRAGASPTPQRRSAQEDRP